MTELDRIDTTSSGKNRAAKANGDGRADLLVIGAGVIGLSCAWLAAEAGLRVRILERSRVGAGASGVAAGMLAPVGEATWGEERLLAMSLASHRLWPGFAKRLAATAGDDGIGYMPLGALHVALDRDETEELQRRFELMVELGLDAEWVMPSQARSLEPSLAPGAGAGVFAAHEAAVDPRLMTTALLRAAESAGAQLLTGDSGEVAGTILGGADTGHLEGVLTVDGREHRAEKTLLAGGSWAGAAAWLPEAARPPIRPVKGEILTLQSESGERVCEHIVVSERVYMVPRQDGRLVIGATVEERGFDTRVTAGGVLELLREAYRALPDIFEMELAETQVGFRPGSPDNIPLIGESPVLDGLVLAGGHYRNGILLAPFTAAAVVGLLTGAKPPDELAAADPVRFVNEGVKT